MPPAFYDWIYGSDQVKERFLFMGQIGLKNGLYLSVRPGKGVFHTHAGFIEDLV